MDKAIYSFSFLNGFGSIVATVASSVAFGTASWLVSHKPSSFIQIGFHRACFDMCMYPYCPNGDFTVVYDGCWWLHNDYFKAIKNWILPSKWKNYTIYYC